MITENPDTFLQDFGVTVVFGSVSGLGILDMPDSVLGEISISTQYELTVKTSVFGGLKGDDSITVDGVQYKVKEFKKEADGVFGVVTLSKV